MIRYEVRDAAIAVGLPAVAAMGIFAVSHHLLPWEHNPRPAVAPASHHNAESVSLDLPPALDSLFNPPESASESDSHDGADRLMEFVFFGGAILTWAVTSALPRERENIAAQALVAPVGIPLQPDPAETEGVRIA